MFVSKVSTIWTLKCIFHQSEQVIKLQLWPKIAVLLFKSYKSIFSLFPYFIFFNITLFSYVFSIFSSSFFQLPVDGEIKMYIFDLRDSASYMSQW